MSKRALAGLLALTGLAAGCEAGKTGEPTPAAPAAPTEAASTSPAPLDAILDALRETDGFARAGRLASLLPGLGPTGVPAVRAALADQSIDLGPLELDLLVRYWATHDPAAATEWVFYSSPMGFRFGALGVAMELWATVDPEAAAQQVRAMGPARGPNTEAAETALIRGWFASGKPGVESYIHDLGQSDEQQHALGVLARSMIQRQGIEASTRWAEALPDNDPSYKLAAFRQLASELTLADPKAGVAWCEKHCAGPFGANVRQIVASQWSWSDGRAAMEWLASAPEGTEREIAVRVAFRGWRYQDEKGLYEWLEAMGPEGVPDWLEPAIGSYAMAISYEKPLQATVWAAQIEDPSARELALISIARRWREKDEAAADAWLAASPLSEEAREKARTPRPKPPERPARKRAKPQDAPPVESAEPAQPADRD